VSNKSFESFVEGTEALRALYSGAWPCFHDAEVIEIHFWRGHVHPGDLKNDPGGDISIRCNGDTSIQPLPSYWRLYT
jgi:hypothetical protein